MARGIHLRRVTTIRGCAHIIDEVCSSNALALSWHISGTMFYLPACLQYKRPAETGCLTMRSPIPRDRISVCRDIDFAADAYDSMSCISFSFRFRENYVKSQNIIIIIP